MATTRPYEKYAEALMPNDVLMHFDGCARFVRVGCIDTVHVTARGVLVTVGHKTLRFARGECVPIDGTTVEEVS